jgi:hypothetical protein
MAERLVRFLPQFFDELDNQLSGERGSDGAPSAADFLLYDLPSMRDRLASGFERNTRSRSSAPNLSAFSSVQEPWSGRLPSTHMSTTTTWLR